MQANKQSRAAAWRGWAGLLLTLAWGMAEGGQLNGGLAAVYVDTSSTTAGSLAERPASDADVRVIRTQMATTVTELDSQLKRQALKAALTNSPIAVFYPDIGEPYRSVFTKIIEGIEEMAKHRVRTYPIGPNANAADLNAQLERNDIKVVIALGRQGLKAASSLSRGIVVVVGGVLMLPEAENSSLSGISLAPDPALLFARLKNLQPSVRRVFVIYDPHHNEWLIKLAREAAKALGLELVAQEAHDLASAAKLYEAAFAATDSRHDAVWLPHDPTTVDDDTILPLVLKESWSRNIAVFSSSYLHVKKGVLFTLYPDNRELGRNLAGSALAALAGESRKGVMPLREVYTAVNLRTASHIGLNITYQQQRTFDTVFPEP